MADSTVDLSTASRVEAHSSRYACMPGLVLDVDNTDLGNADTSYTYFDLLQEGYNTFALDYVIEATTLTIEGTMDAPEVADASAVWRDITLMLTSGTATITSSGHLSVIDPLPWTRIRVKRVTTNATNALELRLGLALRR